MHVAESVSEIFTSVDEENASKCSAQLARRRSDTVVTRIQARSRAKISAHRNRGDVGDRTSSSILRVSLPGWDNLRGRN